MPPQYRLHRLAGQLDRRCYAVSCLSNSGIALGPFTKGGDDLGVAAWAAPYEGPSSNARQFLSAPSVSIFAVNDAGQFVGHQSNGGGERAVLGVAGRGQPPPSPEQSTPLDKNICSWRRISGAYGINADGDFVGFRMKKGIPAGYLCRSTGELIDLKGDDEAPHGFYAVAINDHGIIVGTPVDGACLLVWSETGALLTVKDTGLGSPLRITNERHILCDYGIANDETEFWIPTAPRCLDFTAADINNLGHVVGSGRPLNRNELNAACFWGPDSACWNLNDLTDDQSVHLDRATAINEAGWIACTGRRREDTFSSAYLLEPTG